MSVYIYEMQVFPIRPIIECVNEAILLVRSLAQTLLDFILPDQPKA